jgi:hypothetical protein
MGAPVSFSSAGLGRVFIGVLLLLFKLRYFKVHADFEAVEKLYFNRFGICVKCCIVLGPLSTYVYECFWNLVECKVFTNSKNCFINNVKNIIWHLFSGESHHWLPRRHSRSYTP